MKLIIELAKLCVLCVAVVAVLCIWTFSGSAAVHMVAAQDGAFMLPAVDSPLEWISATWSAFIVFAKIAFWVCVALLATFIVLLITVVLGVGSFLIQRVTQGIAYLVRVIKSQWTAISTPKQPTEPDFKQMVIATKQDGTKATIQDWMEDRDKTIQLIEKRVLETEKSCGIV